MGMLISPWVKAGTVFQEPKGPTKTSQFDLTSVSATLHKLFNLTTGPSLTKRDAWSGSFHELLLDSPRSDAPMHLPDAPKPSAPWAPAEPASFPGPCPGCSPSPNPSSYGWPAEDDDDDDDTSKPLETLTSADASAPEPQHCSAQLGGCQSPSHVSARQRKRIKWYASLTSVPVPDVESMNH